MTPLNPDPDRRAESTLLDGAGNGSPKEKIAEDARDAKHEVGADAREKAEAGQHRLADEADALSDAIDAAASNLDDQDREGLARYARELSGHLAKAAGQLEGRSVDELANDAKRLARDNPALYMLGSIAVGFGLSRFFKASAERDHDDDNAGQTDAHGQHDDDNGYHTSTYRNGDFFRDDDVSTGTPVQRGDGLMTEMDTTTTASRSGEGREMR